MKQLFSAIKENFNRSDSIIKESMLVGSAEYFMLGALFVINILISRYYGLGELGSFNFCYAIAQISILGIGSSFSLILRRDITLYPEKQESYINQIIRLRFFLLIATIIVLLPAVYAFDQKDTHLLVFLMIIFLIKGFDLFSETYYTTYQSLQLYKRFSIVKSLNAFCSLCIVFICCILRLPVISLYLSLLAVAIIFFLFNIYYYQKTKNYFDKNNSITTVSSQKLRTYLVKESWPLMANAIFYQVSSRISVVLIFVLLGKEDAGLFSTGLIIVTMFSAAASALGIVMFPKINKKFNDNSGGFSDFLVKLSAWILLLGIVVYGLFLLISPFIKSFFGDMPDNSNSIYIIMGASIPFIFLAGAIGNIFTIIRRQQTGMFVASIVLVFNVGILYLGIFLLKTTGFAIAFTIGNALQILLIGFVALNIIKKKATSYISNNLNGPK